MAILFEQVSHRFGEKSVLENVSFSIKEGEIFGLLGPSGAGKTTIIKILTGQLKQSTGAAGVLGCDCNSLPEKVYRSMGIMMDNLGLYERLSVYDNLLFFAKLQNVKKERIPEVLKAVGLEQASKTPVLKLSKGMKNRVSFARAILCECKVLFLDEPTSGLDPATAEEIHMLIKTQRDWGCTVFMTTHNMEEAEKLCDTAALLYQGKIVEQGSPRELCLRHNRKESIEVVFSDGEIKVYETAKAMTECLQEELKNRKLVSIHSQEPGLKEVFLELTGAQKHEMCSRA